MEEKEEKDKHRKTKRNQNRIGKVGNYKYTLIDQINSVVSNRVEG